MVLANLWAGRTVGDAGAEPPPPRLLEMGLSEKVTQRGRALLCRSSSGRCKRLLAPALAPQHPAHPMGCGCCDPWEPPAPPGLRDMLHGQDRGVGMEGLGAT